MKLNKKYIGLVVGVLAIIVITVFITVKIMADKKNGGTDTEQDPAQSQIETDTGSEVTASQTDTGSGTDTDEPDSSQDQTGGGPGSDEVTFIGSLVGTDAPALSEEEKLSQIDFSDRYFTPVYNPAVSLTAGTGSDSDAQAGAPWTCVVTPDSGQTQTFTLSINQDVSAQTSRIIWQVSLFPFDGGAATASDTPNGMLMSGELSKSAKTFSVDFSVVYRAETSFYHPSLNSGSLTFSGSLFHQTVVFPSFGLSVTTALGRQSMTPLRTYYVRAFPVDSAGNSVGDAGAGLPVLYGDLQQGKTSGNLFQIIPMKFSLMLAKGPGQVTHNGEFPNDFIDKSESTMYNTSDKTYAVLPSGYPFNTKEFLIQVSLSDFSGSAWTDVPGLVYESSVASDDQAFKELGYVNTYGISIDFSQFVPADSALPENDFIRYFVRVVALTEGAQPGTAYATYSETVRINYGKYQASDIKFYPEIKIDPQVPVVESFSFTPVHWEASGWQYHYVVTRQPTEKEVFMGLVGSDNPYAAYPVGTKIDFTPHPEDKSWWEEAWDAISDFFGSIADFAAKLVNWVSSAYADLKSGIINIAVSALPESWQGPMRTALTALADYGLASIGIPPTLPNFDELANMGTDYLATVAMEQAGIPADSIIAYGAEELAGEIGNQLTSSASSASPNPMNWDFVKLDPDYLYRPAYITLELYNPYDEPTPAGKLSFIVDKFMDMSKNGFDPSITRLYALYGSSYVCLFKPVFGMEIPSLAPGQRLTVPVILEPYVGTPLPGCSAPVSTEGFQLMYGLGAYDFSLRIVYDLPSITDEAKNQGHTEEAIYSYSSMGSTFGFSHDPYDSFSK